MNLRDLNYYLSVKEGALHNKFVGWNGNDLEMRNVSFRTSMSGSTLSVSVSAGIRYSDSGFYTRSYAESHFQESCREYVEEILDEMDADGYSRISYHFSLSFSRK